MTWFKVDDKLHAHKKAARAGEAMALWVIAGSWSADQLTDGFVPDYIAARLIPDGASMADRLVKAGFWFEDVHDGDVGFRFKDWDDYQPTRDEVESKRESERDRKRNQRRSKSGQFEESRQVSQRDNERTDDGTPGGVTPCPSRPVPSRTKESNTLSTVVDRAEPEPDEAEETFEHFWAVYPARDGKKLGRGNALIEWRRLTQEQRRRAFTAAKHLAASDQRPKDAERFLRRAKGGKGDFPFDDWQEPAKPDVRETKPRQDAVAAKFGAGAR